MEVGAWHQVVAAGAGRESRVHARDMFQKHQRIDNLDGGRKIMGPPCKAFFSTSAYFVNGNTQLMFDLTGN